MLLLSLGPKAVSALLWHGAPPRFAGPDLAWLLARPDVATSAAEAGGSGADMRYGICENILSINDLTG